MINERTGLRLIKLLSAGIVLEITLGLAVGGSMLLRRLFINPPCDPPLAEISFDGMPDKSISKRMKEIFNADQAARQTDNVDWSKVSKEDRERRVEVMAYLQQGKITAAEDLYQAAFIFQHGDCPDHYQLANRLAEKSIQAGYGPARWIYAAALDRYLMSLGKPQKFGTQYRADAAGRWELYPVDPATTDDERAQYHVPSLAAALARADQMNGAK